MGNKAWKLPVVALAVLASAGPAGAQEVARVNAVVRVVKTAPPNSTAFSDARLGAPLAAGARVRTGGRSKAGVVFTDGSTLRLDELTEVVIGGGRQRDTRVLGGRVFGQFTRAGTITGGYGTAAVRGTQVIYFEDPATGAAYVRCYDDSAVVSRGGINLRAGQADGGTETTLTDEELIEDPTAWAGATLRILGGANEGQERPVAGFDPVTGTVTVAPAFPAVIDTTSEYLITSDPAAEMVTLGPNEGTAVIDGRPLPPYAITPLAFAEGQRTPWFKEIKEGVSTRTFPGTLGQAVVQEEQFALDEAVDAATNQPDAGDLSNLLGPGEVIIVVPPVRPGLAPERVALRRHGPQSSPTGQPVEPTGHLTGAVLNDSARRSKPNPGTDAWFTADSFGVGASNGYSAGVRGRAHMVRNNVYVEVGGLLMRFDNEQQDANIARISEGFVQLRQGDLELVAGRQHLFLGPASRLSLGALLGFNTADAAVVRADFGRYTQQFGYLANTSPIFGNGFDGAYGRGELAVGEGLLGWNVLEAFVENSILGWSADFSYPVLPEVADAYALGGFDPFHNRILGAGIYFPGVFQRTGLDVYLEYADREILKERAQLSVRRAVGDNWILLAFVEKKFGGDFDGGVGAMYQVRFP